jgi:hypothetical protein
MFEKRGRTGMGSSLSIVLGLAVGACSAKVQEDPALEREIDRQLVAAEQISLKFGELVDTPDDYSSFTDIRDAERPLRQLHTACATRIADRTRVLLVDGRGPIVDGPAQGPWFDYAWRKAGC